jgi:hypothetical protein
MSALFQALRAGIHEVRAPLERLRDCPDIPAEQREEIRNRLSRAFGLMRLGQ